MASSVSPSRKMFSASGNLPLKNGRLEDKPGTVQVQTVKLLEGFPFRCKKYIAKIVRKVTVGMIYPYNLVGITIQ